MFKRTSRALAAVMLTTLVGCSSIQPTHAPTSPPTADTLTLSSATVASPLLTTIRNAYRDANPHITIQTRTASHDQLLNELLNDNISYFISPHLNPNQPLWAAPLARDGLAIITHPSNPIRNLTTDQLRRIYQGFTDNWRDLNGDDQPIIHYGRSSSAALQREFERLVMGQRRISPATQLLPSVEATIQRVRDTPGAIGFIPVSQRPPDLEAVHINDIAPDQSTIGSNQYPLRYTIYIIGQGEPQGIYRDVVGWIQSPAGQDAIIPPYAPLLRQLPASP